MAILDTLLTGGLFDFAGKILDKVFPDPEARAKAQVELLTMQQKGELAELAAETDLAKAQLAVNQVEASNPSMFVAGARPFILWICGLGLGYDFLLRPIAQNGVDIYVAVYSLPHVSLTSLDLTTLLPLLFGMLGLGGYRTVEKLNGVARNSLQSNK